MSDKEQEIKALTPEECPEAYEDLPDEDSELLEESEDAETSDTAEISPNNIGVNGGNELSSLQDKYLRLAAEYDNFRKRTKKERESDFTWAQSDLIRKLLPVIDAIERGVIFNERSESIAAVKEGLVRVSKMIFEILEKEGLQKIDQTGIPHDLNLHDLVFAENHDELEDGTILEIFETGYQLNDRVLRPAKVKVSKGT